MEFFNSAIEVLQTLVVALGAGLGVWGAINRINNSGYDGDSGVRRLGCLGSMVGKELLLSGYSLPLRVIVP